MYDKQQAFKKQLDRSIDYASVLDQIAAYCAFSRSIDLIRGAMPYTNIQEAREQLDYVKEGMEYVRLGKEVSMGGVNDIQPYIDSAVRSIALLPNELNSIALS